MPESSQVIATSGIGPTAAVPEVLVTFTGNELGYQLPWPNTGNQLIVPGFMFLQGSVVYAKDNQGNVLAMNPNKDGSLPA